ncbi:NTP pyrophosphatase (non-canonical NTP hydrolase) [Microcella putealis]|uniref:NTP pyrophosphatase (Non-canonical NTP hydrolase) n=1 Tax=Microcella putealis TaxID=337005 RepID=A0A4Q7LU42_9MICO|nr:nucleotide pyrophosphohydrolase [Microcella putealis]RZS57737.1 NTP pyrophosphatase (non-canonical NTP hydrolase) [Microcella putealis]TQM24804.1 NTP pyrophosphatase (non-canonical NTP hydrolase) [Microcella putealis]
MVDNAARDALRAFVSERDWAQFHTPENLAKSIAIEAGELLECYQWNAQGNEQAIRDELADVLSYCILLADRLGLDAEQLVLDKLEKSRAKYPVEKSRGRSDKYDQL